MNPITSSMSTAFIVQAPSFNAPSQSSLYHASKQLPGRACRPRRSQPLSMIMGGFKNPFTLPAKFKANINKNTDYIVIGGTNGKSPAVKSLVDELAGRGLAANRLCLLFSCDLKQVDPDMLNLCAEKKIEVIPNIRINSVSVKSKLLITVDSQVVKFDRLFVAAGVVPYWTNPSETAARKSVLSPTLSSLCQNNYTNVRHVVAQDVEALDISPVTKVAVLGNSVAALKACGYCVERGIPCSLLLVPSSLPPASDVVDPSDLFTPLLDRYWSLEMSQAVTNLLESYSKRSSSSSFKCVSVDPESMLLPIPDGNKVGSVKVQVAGASTTVDADLFLVASDGIANTQYFVGSEVGLDEFDAGVVVRGSLRSDVSNDVYVVGEACRYPAARTLREAKEHENEKSLSKNMATMVKMVPVALLEHDVDHLITSAKFAIRKMCDPANAGLYFHTPRSQFSMLNGQFVFAFIGDKTHGDECTHVDIGLDTLSEDQGQGSLALTLWLECTSLPDQEYRIQGASLIGYTNSKSKAKIQEMMDSFQAAWSSVSVAVQSKKIIDANVLSEATTVQFALMFLPV